MTERQLLIANLGGVIAFGIFVILSIFMMDATAVQQVMIVISEVIGGLTIVGAVISSYYIETRQRFVPISIIVFLSLWLTYALGYELGINATTANHWIWFVLFYIIMIAGVVLLRMSYAKIEGSFKLLPVFFLFFNAMLTVYMVITHIWWSLPFAGQ